MSQLADAVHCAYDKGYEQGKKDAVVHGRWIHTGITNVFGGHQHECSVCHYTLMVSPMCDNENYCCNCGAQMDEQEGAEDGKV